MMHFTITHEEKHTGMEFCCDTCNKRCISVNESWWYVRYNIFDKHPSMWICNDCKEEME